MAEQAVELYLDLMKRCLTRTIFPEGLQPWAPVRGGGVKWAMSRPIRDVLNKRGVVLAAPSPVVPGRRIDGRDWPSEAETMIGMKRLDNIQFCVTDAIQRGVPGDLIETGVWRGGATIFMRAILAALGERQRTVWVADSFEGLPKPDPEHYPLDAGDDHWEQDPLKVPLDRVKANFARYGLLDDQVSFLKGWFRDTLPTAPIEQLAVTRLDGDMYESTMDALQALYPKLSAGGYLIVDDYGNEGLAGCKAAVDDYRRDRGITDPIEQVDWTGIFWKKTAWTCSPRTGSAS